MDESTERAVVLVLNALMLGGMTFNLVKQGMPNDEFVILVMLAFMAPASTLWHLLRRPKT